MAFTANELSIKERILVELKRRFEVQVKGAPAADPYTLEWGTVQREPLGDQRRKEHELAILDRSEDPVLEIQNYHVLLDVELEYSSQLPAGDDPSTWNANVQAQISRKLHEDIFMTEGGVDSGGDILALSVTERNSDWVVDDENDRRIEGFKNITIMFKRKIADPRDRVG